MSKAKQGMDAYRAVSIFDGFADAPVTTSEVIAAARYIRDIGPRGVLAGSGTNQAIALADIADRGDDERAEEIARQWAEG